MMETLQKAGNRLRGSGGWRVARDEGYTHAGVAKAVVATPTLQPKHALLPPCRGMAEDAGGREGCPILPLRLARLRELDVDHVGPDHGSCTNRK
mmetsp:Transcript_93115/g.216393  ORF Transcript_93115/g.216393 Transcript_93115/m.216393 type:complete len:94 (-) Transcript_93115:46-327(-)